LATPSTAEPPSSTGGGSIDPRLAFILNLLGAACAGYYLLRQTTKGVIALILFAVLFAPPSCGVGSMVIALLAAIDGYRVAVRAAVTTARTAGS
jgi:hypothetical protein